MGSVPDQLADSAGVWAELIGLGGDQDVDVDRAGELIRVLNERGEPTVVEWALPLLRDADPWRRSAAAWTLGQHGFPVGRPFAAAVTPALAAAARWEDDDKTRELLVTAIGRSQDPAWADELLHHARDRYTPIRESVAASLAIMLAGEPVSPQAIDALIELTADSDPHVRDWATMSLAGLDQADSAFIRAALQARLDDTDDDDTATSGEAALGLAVRHDPTVYPFLQRWLSAPVPQVGNLTVEAAGALGDIRLLPPLYRLRDSGWQRTDPLPAVLDHAITDLEALAPPN